MSSFNQLVVLNWRHNGLDLFGTFNVRSDGWWMDQTATSQYFPVNRVDMTQTANMRWRSNTTAGKWGFNDQWNDNNSFGVTYSVDKGTAVFEHIRSSALYSLYQRNLHGCRGL